MAYAIHIRHKYLDDDCAPISLQAWLAAVARVPGVRLADGPVTAINPTTGEEILISNAGGDAEVLDPVAGEWQRQLFWSSSGRISFRAPDDFDDRNSLLRNISRQLAAELSAVVAGDQGELYS